MKVKVTALAAFQVLQTTYGGGGANIIFYAATAGNVTHAYTRPSTVISEGDFSAAPIALATFQAAFPGAIFRDLSPAFEVTE